MNIAFFGSSLVSSFWNGPATYFRGILMALHERGHRITFYEPDAYQRQSYRDFQDPPWARVVVYRPDRYAVEAAIESARFADLIVKASGVGVFDEVLEAGLLELKSRDNVVVFWDVDAPVTLARIAGDPADRFLPLIRRYDAILTCGGGPQAAAAYASHGARECVQVYNALNPAAHFPEGRDSRYAADVAFLGDRLPDRESRVDEFLLKPAAVMPESSFLLGGSGWDGKALPRNVRYLGHVFSDDHNAFHATPRAVLNVSREGEAESGFSPSARIFEAAGAGACVVTDAWEGIERFFAPGDEILVASNGEGVMELLRSLTWAQAEKIGQAARQRALWEHTYAQRAKLIEAFLEGTNVAVAGAMR